MLGALYVAEIAQPKYRGSLGNCLNVSVAFGITFVMFLGPFLSWRLISIICGSLQILGKRVLS